jgi:hypothetical protein
MALFLMLFEVAITRGRRAVFLSREESLRRFCISGSPINAILPPLLAQLVAQQMKDAQRRIALFVVSLREPARNSSQQ